MPARVRVEFKTIPVLGEHLKLGGHLRVGDGVAAKKVAKSPVKVGS